MIVESPSPERSLQEDHHYKAVMFRNQVNAREADEWARIISSRISDPMLCSWVASAVWYAHRDSGKTFDPSDLKVLTEDYPPGSSDRPFSELIDGLRAIGLGRYAFVPMFRGRPEKYSKRRKYVRK